MSLMLFQTCMTLVFVHTIQVSEVQKNSDFHCTNKKHIFQNTIFCVPQKKLSYTDQEWYKGE